MKKNKCTNNTQHNILTGYKTPTHNIFTHSSLKICISVLLLISSRVAFLLILLLLTTIIIRADCILSVQHHRQFCVLPCHSLVSQEPISGPYILPLSYQTVLSASAERRADEDQVQVLIRQRNM